MDVVEDFCVALRNVPRDPSDLHQDPTPLRHLVKAASTLVAMETTDMTLEQIKESRTHVWTELGTVPSETLSAQNYTPTSKRLPPVCLGTVCFLAVMRLTWLQMECTVQPDVTSVQHLDFCTRHRLSCADPARPIVDYSMSELVTCVQVLRTAFTQLPFHTQLVELIELCEMACARMLFETGNDRVFDIRDGDVRTEVEAGEYVATNQFHCMMWPSFIGFHRRLLVRRLLPTNVDEPPVDDDAMLRLCRWIEAKSREVVYQDASPSLKRYFVRMHLRPGDREINQMQKPGVTVSDAGVVADTLADTRMAQINPKTNLSPAECIKQQLPAWSYAHQPEPVELGFCLYDFFEMITQDMPGCGWNRYYARLELAVEMEEVQRVTRDRPMIVQLFSHWQVVFDNRIYWFNSVIASITFWLFLMSQAQQKRWISHSQEYNAACRSNIYTELVDVVVHNQSTRADLEVPPNTASTVYLLPSHQTT